MEARGWAARHRHSPMGDNGWLVFIGLAIAGLIGLFLYGWMRRKEKPPPGVKPLKDEDDWK
jgi:LPXTG-motif cell wall-anchored protein